MTSVSRRAFLSSSAKSGLGLLAGLNLSSCGQPEPAAQRPNIVFIMADDLGYTDVGCYGQEKIRTPNIDSLAREGLRFTDAYSGCSVCAPARSVLMTGHHMGHTAIRGNGMGSLLPEETTVAEVLKSAGYTTGCFGKWGLGEEPGQPGVPTKKGFDRFFGYLNQAHAHFYYPEFLYENEKEYPLEGNENGQRTTYSHDVIVEKALGFIREAQEGPFFCYVPLTIPHWELLVPEDSMAEYRGQFEELPFIDDDDHYAPQQESHAAYAAMITRMDRDVGRTLSLLKELGIGENTIVFFTSDNGPALPLVGDDYFRSKGTLRGHKGNFYEGGIRVPMIASWPGHVPAGEVSDLPWSFADFLPTAAEFAQAETPSGIDGVSVVPALIGEQAAGRPQQQHDYLYWELLRRAPDDRSAYRDELPQQALRMGDWKAIRPKPDGPIELYNLRDDISESTDVAAQQPDVMRKAEELFVAARTEPRPPLPFDDQWRGENRRYQPASSGAPGETN
jgi:arylsulfatase A-like enzyme